MSHLHYINGQLDVADRYQAYLDQNSAVRLAERKEKARKRSGTRAFETVIDEDDEEEGSPGDPRQGPGSEQGKDQEAGGEQPGEFGKHYA